MNTHMELFVDLPPLTAPARIPVTQGLPFAEGELAVGAPVCVLDASGRPVPTQSHVQATWTREKKWVKWLLIDFQVEAVPGEKPVYQLVYGGDVPSPEADAPVVVSDDGERVVLENGLVSLELMRGAADVFHAFHMFDEGHGPFELFMMDARGTRYSSRTSSMGAQVLVEEAGPLRTCVRVSGYHAGGDGLRFCPYIVRMHMFAGLSSIKVEHTYIFDQDPDAFQLTAVGMHIPFLQARHASLAGSLDHSFSAASFPVEIFQEDERNARVYAKGTLVSSAEKPLGWCAACDGVHTLTATLRDMWQEYPKGLRVTESGIDIMLWPDKASPLDYTNPFKNSPLWVKGHAPLSDEGLRHQLATKPGAPLDLKRVHLGDMMADGSPEENAEVLRDQVERLAPGQPYAFCNTDIATAVGTAKTHEIWLRLEKGATLPAPEQLQAFAASHAEPVLALLSPEKVCATKALRLCSPVNTTLFPEAEQALRELYQALVLGPQERCHIYGMIHYGELINGHNTSDPHIYRSFLKRPDGWKDILAVMGVFNNEAGDMIHHLWTFYLTHGSRAYFRFADAKSRHTADVDFVHAFPEFAQIYPWPNTASGAVGQMHYHSNNNWSGPYVTSHSLVCGLMRHYYLTGNRRSLDTSLGMMENIVRNQTRLGTIAAKGLHRELTGALCTLLEMYQLTWERRLEHLIGDTLAALCTVIQPSGNLGNTLTSNDDGMTGDDAPSGYPGGMLWFVMYDAMRLFPSDWLTDWVVRLADDIVLRKHCDDYTPGTQLRIAREGEKATGAQYHLTDDAGRDWFWHSFKSYANNYLDPIVILALRQTGNPLYLGYLEHRMRAFPDSVVDCINLSSGHSFNCIQMVGDAIPALSEALAPYLPKEREEAWNAWRAAREREGTAVYVGPRTRSTANGVPPGPLVPVVEQHA